MQPDNYTWWSYKMKARARKVGCGASTIFCFGGTGAPLPGTPGSKKDVHGSGPLSPVGLALNFEKENKINKNKGITMPDVFVMMGSASDKDKMKPLPAGSGRFGNQGASCGKLRPQNARTHRGSEDNAEKKRVKVFICAAGMAAHLAQARLPRVP